MATSTGPNLAAAQAAIERLMDDTCVVYRPVDPSATSVLDKTTGSLVRHGAQAPVYEGRCMVGTSTGGNGDTTEGGAALVTTRYQLTLPLGAVEIERGDIATITSARRDPTLIGTRLRITGITAQTFAVSRKMQAKAVD